MDQIFSPEMDEENEGPENEIIEPIIKRGGESVSKKLNLFIQINTFLLTKCFLDHCREITDLLVTSGL